MGLLTGWVSPQILPFSKYLEIARCPARQIKLALREPSKTAWHCQGLERALVVGLRPLNFKRRSKKTVACVLNCICRNARRRAPRGPGLPAGPAGEKSVTKPSASEGLSDSPDHVDFRPELVQVCVTATRSRSELSLC